VRKDLIDTSDLLLLIPHQLTTQTEFVYFTEISRFFCLARLEI
jgi:hypothetical protein